MNFEDARREYDFGTLTRESLETSPFDQFTKWMNDAIDAGLQDPTAMCVATVGIDGKPSQRIVLLKHFDEMGFVFYTNLESRKAKDISNNDSVSLHFPWMKIDRQVSIQGRAEKLGLTTVLKYFLSRPKESQLAAWVSPQSQKIDTRSMLENEYERMQMKFSEGKIPVPSFWGGYRVVPEQWEFWQGGERRLHDRFQYTLDDPDSWEINRLAP
ncbi:MAG: pyridoxamine 5'-phosphate oxidase [Pseudomonadales bacterium]|jgi:pyridoxamine 5'-phosphate oxidase